MADQITIRPAEGKWTVRAGGAVLGESQSALEVVEGNRAPVIYFPKGDVAMAFLDKSDTITTCPYRGEARHFSIQTKSTVIEDAGYMYDAPVEKLAALKDHLAFYAEKATIART
ncbi:hypothetical protein GCM10016455_02210 [Aliiroseovarius zhejiangensis]|uniref:DUF427 domain-containing protein n=1 Tax=Aliiroseovarius zhejiangensis TaxID=1632025 RepID=A0ABQ3IQ50_9RHOB|nr:DUF427 domain-containing protein [Aliiroseovarius zhejiangensis]GHE86251.1 hypothetical protein GCM10016455_02210 [Aliiroseovarius zhejiangensis]